MRKTVTLEPDVVAQLAELKRERGLTFKEAVNQTLRSGLKGVPKAGVKYRMPVRDLGLRADVNVDRIRDVLGALDDERLTA